MKDKNKSIQKIIQVKKLHTSYGDKKVLSGIDIDIAEHKITALIGASGCGKSTFLRCLNRMNDLIDDTHINGKVLFKKENIYDDNIDAVAVRKRIGMVFQHPNPFPKSIYDNIAYAPLMHNLVKKGKECDDLVKQCLQDTNLFDEVKDNLKILGTSLSGGQQQRLCIARTIAIQPEVILMDEPTSALDPISTAKIEELMNKLAKKFTIVIVTHNMQQAYRISDYTAFFHLGQLIEFDETNKIFTKPNQQKTEDYISGRFG